jgi:hypothetical protein
VLGEVIEVEPGELIWRRVLGEFKVLRGAESLCVF